MYYGPDPNSHLNELAASLPMPMAMDWILGLQCIPLILQAEGKYLLRPALSCNYGNPLSLFNGDAYLGYSPAFNLIWKHCNLASLLAPRFQPHSN